MFDAMEPIGLDTLKATRSLEAAGFDAAQAEALVTVLGSPVSGNVATREDVRDLRVTVRDVRTELHDVRTELKAEIHDVRAELKADIEGCRSELKADIDDLRTELKGDIEGCRSELKAGIDDLRTELKGDIGQLRDESVDMRGQIAQLSREMAEARLESRGHVTKAQMYRLLLVHASVVVGLIVGLERLL